MIIEPFCECPLSISAKVAEMDLLLENIFDALSKIFDALCAVAWHTDYKHISRHEIYVIECLIYEFEWFNEKRFKC